MSESSQTKLSVNHQGSLHVETAHGHGKARSRAVLLTTGLSILARVVATLALVISVPLTFGYLGQERYGLWMTIASLVSLLGFADLGIGLGLVNAVSQAEAKNDRIVVRAVVSSCFFFLALIASLLLLGFALMYPLIPWPRVFNVTAEHAALEAGPGFAVFFVCSILYLPMMIVQRVQMGFQEEFVSQLWVSLGSVVGLLGLLLAISLRAGLPWLLLAIGGGRVLAMSLNWFWHFGRTRRWLWPRWKHVQWATTRKVVSSGLLFLILQAMQLLTTASDNLIVAHFLGASQVGPFAVTNVLFTLLLLSAYLYTPLWSAFSDSLARKDWAWSRRTLKRALLACWATAIASGVFLIFFGQPIVALWTQSDVRPGRDLLFAFAVRSIVLAHCTPISSFLNTEGLLRRQVPIHVIASVLSIGFKFILVQHIGAAGVVWATVFGYGIFYALPGTRLAFQSLRKSELEDREGSI